MHPLNRLLKNWLKIAIAFSVIVLITGLTLGYLYFNTLHLIDYDEKDLILEVKNSENLYSQKLCFDCLAEWDKMQKE